MFRILICYVVVAILASCNTVSKPTQVFQFSKKPDSFPAELYTVTIDGMSTIMVRSSPEYAFSRNVIDNIRTAKKIVVTGITENDWYVVEREQGQKGYIPAGMLTSIQPTEIQHKAVSTLTVMDEYRHAKLSSNPYSVLVKFDPYPESNTLTYIAEGERVNILGLTNDNKWYKVQVISGNHGITPGLVEGFVMAEELVKVKPLSVAIDIKNLSRKARHKFRVWQESKRKFSAFAISTNGAWGYSYSYRTTEGAKKAALDYCGFSSCYVIGVNGEYIEDNS